MSTEEFSNGFSTMLNSYAVSAGFGEAVGRGDFVCDEYEKSFWLTQAQSDLVVSLYTGRNSSGNSFDETEELRRYLSPLVVSAELQPIGEATTEGSESTSLPSKIDSSSTFFSVPSDAWFIVYEVVQASGSGQCVDGKLLDVMPVTYDEYNRIKRNPFRGANGRRALRLDLSKGEDDTVGIVEIVSPYALSSYHLRYLKKPTPIIVSKLDVSIDGVSDVSECQLPASLHLRILEMAVRMAFQSKGAQIESGQNRRNT